MIQILTPLVNIGGSSTDLARDGCSIGSVASPCSSFALPVVRTTTIRVFAATSVRVIRVCVELIDDGGGGNDV